MAEAIDLAFRLALRGGCGKALGDSLAVHLVGQARMRMMARVTWTMTMATRITAATAGSRDRAGAKIPKLGNLPQDSGPLLFQFGEGVRHGAS